MKMLLSCLLAASPALFAQQPATPNPAPVGTSAATTKATISPGSKLFIEPMDGFEAALSAAMLKKGVPVVIVDEKAKADFVVSGTSAVHEAGWAKTIFISPNAHASASIMVKDAHEGTLVFAYNVDKTASSRGAQSTAEACAKHLKGFIEKGKR